MFKRALVTVAIAGLTSTAAFADVGFETNTSGWSLSGDDASLTRETSVSLPVVDVYSLNHNPFYTANILPVAGTAFGALALDATSTNGGTAMSSATATYTFASATNTADTAWVRFITADGPYYSAGGPNDALTLTLNGSYGQRTYNIEIESADGGGVNAVYVTGDLTTTYLVAQGANGVDSGWLGFSVLGGTQSLSVTAKNIYDDAGGNVPYAAFDYSVGAALPAVPEPAEFALMFAGLGVVGAAARRRRQRDAAAAA